MTEILKKDSVLPAEAPHTTLLAKWVRPLRGKSCRGRVGAKQQTTSVEFRALTCGVCIL